MSVASNICVNVQKKWSIPRHTCPQQSPSPLICSSLLYSLYSPSKEVRLLVLTLEPGFAPTPGILLSGSPVNRKK